MVDGGIVKQRPNVSSTVSLMLLIKYKSLICIQIIFRKLTVKIANQLRFRPVQVSYIYVDRSRNLVSFSICGLQKMVLVNYFTKRNQLHILIDPEGGGGISQNNQLDKN